MKKYLFPTLLALSILTSATLFARPAQAGIVSNLQNMVIDTANKASSLLTGKATPGPLQVTNPDPISFKVGKEYSFNITGGTGQVNMEAWIDATPGGTRVFTKKSVCAAGSCTVKVPYNNNYNGNEDVQKLEIKICDSATCINKVATVSEGDPLFTARIVAVDGATPVIVQGQVQIPVGAEIKVEVTPTDVVKSLPEYNNGSVYISLYDMEDPRTLSFAGRSVLKPVYSNKKALNNLTKIDFTIPASATKDLGTISDYAEKYISGLSKPPYAYIMSVGLSNYCQPLDQAAGQLGITKKTSYSNGCETKFADVVLKPQIFKEFRLNNSDGSIQALNLFLNGAGYDVPVPVVTPAFGVRPFLDDKNSVFSVKTEVALKQFQKDMGLSQTGKTDTATRNVINSSIVGGAKTETKTPGIPSIQIISPTANDVYVQGQPITVKWKAENLPPNNNIRILLRPPYFNPNLPLERVSYVFETNTTLSPDSTFTIPGKHTLQLPTQTFNQTAAGGYRVILSLSKDSLYEWGCYDGDKCANFSDTFQVYPQILNSITLRNYSVQTKSGPSGSPYPIINTPDTQALINFLTSRGYTSTPFMASDGLQAVSNAFAVVAPKNQDSALRQYQRASGITGEDGWVGPKTRAFINKEIEKAPTFKVVPFLRLTTPNGGERFTVGERIPVKWTSYGENITEVDVNLTQANGTFIDSLTTTTVKDVSFKDGLAYVVIPKAGTYKIRIAGGTLTDISDAAFTVSAVTPPIENPILPEVSVSKTSVSSGDVVRYDISTHTSNRMELILKCPTGVVAINQTNNSNICTTPYIYPTNNNGVRLSTAILVKFTNTNPGVVAVEPLLKSYKDNVSTSAVVISANKVTILPAPVVTPTITLVSPNGGETYTAGDQIVIKWNNTGTTASDRVKITLNNYSLSPTAIAEVPANDGSYTWTTPSNAGKDGIYKKIQVSLGGTTVTDESNNWFIINSAPVVTPPVVTPPIVTPPTTPVIDTPQTRSDSPLQLTTVNGVNFYESFGGPIPEVTSISRTSAKQGDTITITGKNFSTTENNMIFIDTLAGGVWQVDAKATDNGTRLTFRVGNWGLGQYYVYVTNSNGQSNFKGLKITDMSSANLFWALWNLIF